MPVEVCVDEHQTRTQTRLAAIRKTAYLLHVPMSRRWRECTLAASYGDADQLAYNQPDSFMRFRVVLLTIVMFLFTLTAAAQRGAGVNVIGSVVDQTGAVLPFAHVQLRS